MPTVSVIMNCYNGERTLREAIDSIYAQSFADWEIVFWDNASTDGTEAIARSFADGRLRYFRAQTNTTLGEARRRAMREARGEWVGFLDCDDWWFPNKLERQLAALRGGGYVLCYAGIREVTPTGARIRDYVPAYPSGWMLEQQLLQFDINMVTPLLHRPTLEEHHLEFDSHVTASEEYNLFVRLAAKGPFCTVPEVLGAWRISPGSLTDRQIARWGEERHYTLAQLERENPGIAARHPGAFREARARGDYYTARHYMTSGRTAEARRLMQGIGEVDYRYRLLWLGMHVPFFWEAVHGQFLKRKVLPRLLGIVRSS